MQDVLRLSQRFQASVGDDGHRLMVTLTSCRDLIGAPHAKFATVSAFQLEEGPTDVSRMKHGHDVHMEGILMY